MILEPEGFSDVVVIAVVVVVGFDSNCDPKIGFVSIDFVVVVVEGGGAIEDIFFWIGFDDSNGRDEVVSVDWVLSFFAHEIVTGATFCGTTPKVGKFSSSNIGGSTEFNVSSAKCTFWFFSSSKSASSLISSGIISTFISPSTSTSSWSWSSSLSFSSSLSLLFSSPSSLLSTISSFRMTEDWSSSEILFKSSVTSSTSVWSNN